MGFDNSTIRTRELSTFMHEISNDGAIKMFETFVQDLILPVMIKAAGIGERECHIVVLTDDDTTLDEEDTPPSLSDEPIYTIKSTKMYKFFRFIENREVAKDFLKDSGLKRIRIGIEGFPINKEEVTRRLGGAPRTETIYNYVQR